MALGLRIEAMYTERPREEQVNVTNEQNRGGAQTPEFLMPRPPTRWKLKFLSSRLAETYANGDDSLEN